MLKTLSRFDRRTIERVLSDVTTAFLPTPEIASQEQTRFDSSLYENVKAEINQLLQIDPSDLSLVNRAKVLEFLAHEMSEIALAEADIEAIKARIGQRGEVRPLRTK